VINKKCQDHKYKELYIFYSKFKTILSLKRRNRYGNPNLNGSVEGSVPVGPLGSNSGALWMSGLGFSENPFGINFVCIDFN
jgi:hypothetical protein